MLKVVKSDLKSYWLSLWRSLAEGLEGPVAVAAVDEELVVPVCCTRPALMNCDIRSAAAFPWFAWVSRALRSLSSLAMRAILAWASASCFASASLSALICAFVLRLLEPALSSCAPTPLLTARKKNEYEAPCIIVMINFAADSRQRYVFEIRPGNPGVNGQ